MSKLTPNVIYTMNGVKVNEKIIPDGTVWKNGEKAAKSGFRAGEPYKKGMKLSGNTGKVRYVTIHNTNYLSNVSDDAEQYTRATYNENMGSARVHFYIDENGAWQNLRAGTGLCTNDPVNCAEVSWHAGDGSSANGGNMTSLSLELIMGDNAQKDEKTVDNGARVAAWLLWKHGLKTDALVTHTYWVNQARGKHFANVDEQCTNRITGGKWCPAYIFASQEPSVARKNWMRFKERVAEYLAALSGMATEKKPETAPKVEKPTGVSVNDLVSIADNATYYNGQSIPKWVRAQRWYVKSVISTRAVIDQNESKTNAICSPIHVKYLTVVRSAKTE